MDSHNNPYHYRKDHLHLLYKLRKILPRNVYFYYAFYIIKYLPLYIISHNVSNFEPKPLFTIHHNLLALSFFGYGYSKYETFYKYIIYLIFIFLCLFLMLGLLVRFQVTQKMIRHKNLVIKSTHKNKFKKIPLILFSLLFTLISFFGQHLVEFNLLGILNFIHSDLKLLPLITGPVKALIFIFNILNIIIVIFISEMFFIITSDFSLRHCFKEYKNVIFQNKINFFVIVGSLYGLISIFSYENGLKGKEKIVKNYHFYLNIVVAAFLIVQIWELVSTFNYYNQNFVNKIRLFFSYLCLISSLDELILKYVNKKQLTQGYSLCKVTLEIINAVIFTSININFISKLHLNNLRKNFFQKKHSVNVNEIFAYMELIYEYQKRRITFDQIFSIFSQHKMNCKENDCACKLMEMSEVVDKDGNIDAKAATVYFEAVGQNEIKKSIHYFYKNNVKKDLLQVFILLHTEHLFTIKKEYNLALYITFQYLSHKTSEKFDFLTILYLYEYQYKIFRQITKLKRKKADFKETAREKLTLRKNILFRKKFVVYTQILEKINELLDNCCNIVNQILNFRKKAIMRSNISSDVYSNCENFISLCKEFQFTNDLLSKNILSFSGKFKHYELSYLLTYYYLLIFKRIPKKIQNKICHIDTKQSFDIENYRRNRSLSYSNFKMENPMIVFLDKNDDFIIQYVANNLAVNLHFTTKELLSRCINELIPPTIREFHKVIMKKYVLFRNDKFTKTTFILDKENFLQEAKVTALPIPTIKNNIGIIFCFELINLQNTDDNKTTVTKNNNNKPNENGKFDLRMLSIFQETSVRKQRKKIDFNLIIDNEYNFTCINRNFATEFFFNFEMLNILKMDFCSFFGIYPEKLRNAFRNLMNKENQTTNSIISSNKKYIHPNEIYELFKDDKRYYKIFSLGDQNLMFKKVDEDSPGDIKFQKFKVNTVLPKSLIIKNIPNILKTINEIGLDIEWFTRANCFRERLLLIGSSSGFAATYTYVPLEGMSYIIVKLTEKVNQTVHQTKMEGFNTSIVNVNAFSNTNDNNIQLKLYRGVNILSPMLPPKLGKQKKFLKKTSGTFLIPAVIPENPEEHKDKKTLTNKYKHRSSVSFSLTPPKFEGIQMSNSKKSNKNNPNPKNEIRRGTKDVNSLVSMYNSMYEAVNEKNSNKAKAIVSGIHHEEKDNNGFQSPDLMNMFVKSSHFDLGFPIIDQQKNMNKSDNMDGTSTTSISLTPNLNGSITNNSNFLTNTGLNSSINSSGQLLPKSPYHFSRDNQNNFDLSTSFDYVSSIHIITDEFFKFQTISKYFGLVSFLLFITLIGLSLFTFLFNRNLMILSKGLFDVNIYSLLIKSDIFFGALSVLTCCENAYREKQDELATDVGRLGFRGKELISDYSKLMKTLNSLSDNRLEHIFDILNMKSTYHNINTNFKVVTKESTFHEEILLYHHILIHISQQKIPFQQCRLHSIFHNESIYIPDERETLEKEIEQSFEEEAVAYIVKNVMTNFKRNLEELTRTTNSAFIYYIKESKNKVVIYNSSICFIALVLLFIMLTLVYNYKKDIQILVSVIYTDRETDLQISRGLFMIMELSTNFNKDRCGDFEKNKEVITNAESSSSSKFSALQAKSSNEKLTKQLKIKKSTKKSFFGHKNSSVNPHGHNNGNNNHHKNVSSHFLNHVVRNSPGRRHSIIPIRFQEQSPFANTTGYNPDKKTLRLNQENSEILISIYPRALTTPPLVEWSLYIIIIIISIFIIIEIVNLIVVYHQYDDLYLMNLISINFIDRLQKLCEIEIYAKISVLLKDPYYLTTEQSKYNSLSYSNYYNISFDIHNNYVFNTLGDSEFSFLYYQSLQIGENIAQYIHNKHNAHLLESTLALHKLLDEDYGVCIYGAVGFTVHNITNSNLLSLTEHFKEINRIVSNCKRIGGGMTLNPLNNLIDLILSEIVKLYCDFVKTPLAERDSESYLTSYIVAVSNTIVTDPLKKLQNTIILTELNDMNKVYDWNGVVGIIFSIILVADLVVSMLIFDGYLIREIERKIEVLRMIQKILS